MKTEDVYKFEKIQGQLQGLYNEIGTLSKKTPNDPLNKFKLKFINQILISANEFLDGKYKPFQGFEKFEDDELPTNSDVTIILEQYLTCLENFRTDNVSTKDSAYGWFWLVDGKASNLKTTTPNKLKFT